MVGIRTTYTLASIGLASAIKNPIISGWNPDPSVVRVGQEYFLATSSFEYFPSTPIYKSTDLANWELVSHGFQNASDLQLYGVPTGAGTWAPSLSYFNDRFYLASVTRWTYDPVARVWPRVYYTSSPDLQNWGPLTWCDAWGIDPELFNDPGTGRTYLNLMSPNNDQQRLWGIYQCEIDLFSGSCIGEYRPLWNGTLPHNSSSRPEGPKMLFKDGYYYLLIAEGGTDEQHRATIARSRFPQGPFNELAPNNPLLFNGAYGFRNLTVQSTGHATLFDTPEGEWYASFLARRNINGSSPLGREAFLTRVEWNSEGWPVFNGGSPILLSQDFGPNVSSPNPQPPFYDDFSGGLRTGWYQLRTPYTTNFNFGADGLTLRPNVFDLSQRDTPAALLRKQKSLNMTFSATLSPATASLGPRMKIGISAYLSEFQHQDIGVSGCQNRTGMCLYTDLIRNGTVEHYEESLNTSHVPDCLTFHIRAEPLTYNLGYSFSTSKISWLSQIESKWQAYAPAGWFVFEGNSFAIFAAGDGEPWAYKGPEIGFTNVTETYYEENIPDHDRWEL